MPQLSRTRILLFGSTGLLGRQIHAALTADAVVTAPTRADCDLATTGVAELARLLAAVRPDVVVNCAGRTVGDNAELIRIHLLAVAALAEAMADVVPGTRLVRIGSAAEYGVVPSGRPVGEDDPARPVSPYGFSHLAATQFGELVSTDGRVEVVTLRVFNPVGPGLPADSALGRAAALLRRGGRSPLAVRLLDTVRDFVDLRDIAAAVRAAALATRLPHRLFNVGSGRPVGVRDAVTCLARAAGHSGELGTGEFSPTVNRSAAVPWMCADISRARQVLGWSPSYDLTDSVKALLADHHDGGPHSRR